MSRPSVVILVEQGVQDQEFFYPYYRLQEANCQIYVAVPDANKTVTGKHGIPITGHLSFDHLDKVDMAIDAVIVPGGWECPERLRTNLKVLQFVKKMADKAITAAICHGPWVLISAGVVRGKNMTCYKGMADDLINAGANYVDSNVVVDGQFITAPHYRNNPEFMAAVIKALDARMDADQ